MSELATQIVINVLTSSGVTAGLVFVVKNYISERIKRGIQYEYDLKLDSHKNDLQRESNRELEELKAALKINEIKISALHEKQAEAIEQIHEKLWALFDSLNSYTTVFQARTPEEKKEKREAVADKLDAFNSHLKFKALYIPKYLHDDLKTIKQSIMDNAFEFMHKIERENGEEMIENWDKIHKTVNEKIHGSVTSLEDEFRKVLGAS